MIHPSLTPQETIKGIDQWKPLTEQVPTWEEIYQGFETPSHEFAFKHLQRVLVDMASSRCLTLERQLDILERSVKECRRQIAINKASRDE